MHLAPLMTACDPGPGNPAGARPGGILMLLVSLGMIALWVKTPRAALLGMIGAIGVVLAIFIIGNSFTKPC